MSNSTQREAEAPIRRNRDAESAGPAPMKINMMPMIDVVFQLLIFFLLATQMRTTEEGLWLSRLPQTTGVQKSGEPPLRPIKIRLLRIGDGLAAEDCQIVVENVIRSPKDFSELCQVLQTLKEQSAAYSDESPVLLIPQADVRYEHVVDAFNAVVRAKFKSINFAS